MTSIVNRTIALHNGHAEVMGEGVVILVQKDEQGCAHNVVVTTADLKALLAATEGGWDRTTQTHPTTGMTAEDYYEVMDQCLTHILVSSDATIEAEQLTLLDTYNRILRKALRLPVERAH